MKALSGGIVTANNGTARGEVNHHRLNARAEEILHVIESDEPVEFIPVDGPKGPRAIEVRPL